MAIRRIRAFSIGVLVAGFAVGSYPAWAQRRPEAPEAAGPENAPTSRGHVFATKHMVVAANPYAAEAGRAILRAGGSAADAAIAVQLVLGLVEPQSSGLGGGAFLLHWSNAESELRTYDGRETAPAAARPDRFLRDGKPLAFPTAMRSGLAVGVPGTVRLLEAVHRKHGRLKWADLFAPALRLAVDGFEVSPRLSALLAGETAASFSATARSYFFDTGGRAWPVGYKLRNPAYAATLKRIAEEGSAAFYTGEIASSIVQAVTNAARLPGDISIADLQGYQVQERPAACVAYRRNRVCSMGPPSSGGIAIGQALMLLEGFDLGNSPAQAMAPGAIHLIAEALRLAFADRNWYVADSQFAPVPKGLLDPGYIDERRRLIDPFRGQQRTFPGIPPATQKFARGDDATFEAAGTSHISIIDASGDAVSMTTTIEAGFGSGLMASGFLLNNEMTDFSFRARDGQGGLIANRVEGGKRPRSSMAPVMVFDANGRLMLVTGSPGGSRIIPYVLKTLIGVIDWKLDPQAAADLVNFSSTSAVIELEAPILTLANVFARAADASRSLRLAIGLTGLGRSTAFAEMTSGTHTIRRLPDGRLQGGSDRRREGRIAGD